MVFFAVKKGFIYKQITASADKQKGQGKNSLFVKVFFIISFLCYITGNCLNDKGQETKNSNE